MIMFCRGISSSTSPPTNAVISSDGGPATPITDFTDGLDFNFAFSQDGSKLLLSRGTFSRDLVLLTNAG